MTWSSSKCRENLHLVRKPCKILDKRENWPKSYTGDYLWRSRRARHSHDVRQHNVEERIMISVLEIVGKVAGIGGIALGVFLLLYRDIIRKLIFPRLTKEQAYHFLRLIAVLVWTTAIAGLIAWTYVATQANAQVPSDSEVEHERQVIRELLSALTKIDVRTDPEDGIAQINEIIEQLRKCVQADIKPKRLFTLPRSDSPPWTSKELSYTVGKFEGAVDAFRGSPNFDDAAYICEQSRQVLLLVYSQLDSGHDVESSVLSRADNAFQQAIQLLMEHPEIQFCEAYGLSIKRRYEFFKKMRAKGSHYITPRELRVANDL